MRGQLTPSLPGLPAGPSCPKEDPYAERMALAPLHAEDPYADMMQELKTLSPPVPGEVPGDSGTGERDMRGTEPKNITERTDAQKCRVNPRLVDKENHAPSQLPGSKRPSHLPETNRLGNTHSPKSERGDEGKWALLHDPCPGAETRKGKYGGMPKSSKNNAGEKRTHKG